MEPGSRPSRHDCVLSKDVPDDCEPQVDRVREAGVHEDSRIDLAYLLLVDEQSLFKRSKPEVKRFGAGEGGRRQHAPSLTLTEASEVAIDALWTHVTRSVNRLR